jgi:maltokinase
MTDRAPTAGWLTEERRETLGELVAAYAARRPGWAGVASGPVRVIDAQMMVPGRPGVIDVVADIGGRVVHEPLGLRAPGDDSRFLAEGEDPVLGLFEDVGGLAVVFGALHDAEAAGALVEVVSGRRVDPALVRLLRMDDETTVLAAGDALVFTVFNDAGSPSRRGLETLVALDDMGFNHIAAPLALWRRAGRDLGVVQEYLAGASDGYALALTSVRDLYASGGPPEEAGGDFGAEAHLIGTMAARMHLALERAFGRQRDDAAVCADEVEAVVAERAPELLERQVVTELLGKVRALEVPLYAIRTHGDFRLGLVCRTELGWYVVDFPSGPPVTSAGARPGTEGGAVLRSPLADVADMLWSFGRVAVMAAEERDPTGQEGLRELAGAWERRNRRAFFAGYLGVPGISGLVPPGHDAVRLLSSCFELERTATANSRSRSPG